jgi:hypothetical protein
MWLSLEIGTMIIRSEGTSKDGVCERVQFLREMSSVCSKSRLDDIATNPETRRLAADQQQEHQSRTVMYNYSIYHWPLGTVFLRFNARPASVCLFVCLFVCLSVRVPQPYMIQWPCGAFQNGFS